MKQIVCDRCGKIQEVNESTKIHSVNFEYLNYPCNQWDDPEQISVSKDLCLSCVECVVSILKEKIGDNK